MRINKFLSLAGIASRRQADKLILSGSVFINDTQAKIGDQINTGKDIVTFNQKIIQIPTKFEYLILNKPPKVLTASRDKDKKTVMDLVDRPNLFPIGRLDYDSTGLIILTNDGDLSLKLTHPKYHIPKTYRVKVREDISDKQLKRLANGVKLKEATTLPATINPINSNTFEIILHQGLNRQIRRMCGVVGLSVETLERISIGPITATDLQQGSFRELTSGEISKLKSLTSQ